MAQITAVPITDQKTWEKIASKFLERNFLHSYTWGKFHASLGKYVHFTTFNVKVRNLDIGLMISIVEKAKRATYLTVPAGPLIDWKNKDLTKAFKKEIISQAKKHNCSFIRVRPQIIQTPENLKMFKNLGFKKAPMYLHAELTHQLDLSKSKDELLANMRKSTRYEIKRGQKLGIKITTTTDIKKIDQFYKLQLQTARRHKFVPFSKQFLKTQFKTFVDQNQAMLYQAHYKNKLLSQAIIIFYGLEADYHYSVSTPDNFKYPGSYLIQWQAILDAKAKGLKRYNFWGVASETDKKHRFYGVSVFKRGFRGQDVQYLPAHDLVINQSKYVLNWLIESLRKLFRRV